MYIYIHAKYHISVHKYIYIQIYMQSIIYPCIRTYIDA